jgi:hypothetical protein
VLLLLNILKSHKNNYLSAARARFASCWDERACGGDEFYKHKNTTFKLIPAHSRSLGSAAMKSKRAAGWLTCRLSTSLRSAQIEPPPHSELDKIQRCRRPAMSQLERKCCPSDIACK